MNVVDLIIQLASLLTSITLITLSIKKYFVVPLEKRIKDVNMEQYRTYLIDNMADISKGISKTPIQMARIYEVYDKYIKNGGNSYVHEEWEKLKKIGKI